MTRFNHFFKIKGQASVVLKGRRVGPQKTFIHRDSQMFVDSHLELKQQFKNDIFCTFYYCNNKFENRVCKVLWQASSEGKLE